MTVNIPLEDHSRIDDFLPDHDFSSSYDIHVKAPASAVYERLLSLDFGKLRVVRALMMIRTGKRPPRKTVSGDLRQRLQGAGFVILVEVPNQELVMGVAGRFWRPDGGRYMELTADDFTRFVRFGYAKAAWNFRVRTESLGSTVLSTETRIKCFGPGALRAFRMYWGLVGPFSGLMRKAILKKVKTEAVLQAKS